MVICWIGFGVGSRAEAGGLALSTPAGLSPGESFRFVFVTDGSITGTSTNIADYNNFVNAQAGGATYNGSVVTWVAIASTPTVNAVDNVGQSLAPVYLSNGTEVTTSTTSSGLWSGTLLNPIGFDLNGMSVNNPYVLVWTGSFSPQGIGATGQQLGTAEPQEGLTNATNQRWLQTGAGNPGATGSLPLYGISEVLTVSPSAVPEPSSLGMAGTAISAVLAYGWSRHRRDQRRQRPVGQPDATE